MMAFAAEHATPKLIKQLEQCYQRMLTSLGNQQEFIRADMDFYRTLMRFMDNHYISDFYGPLLDGTMSIVCRLTCMVFTMGSKVISSFLRPFVSVIRTRCGGLRQSIMIRKKNPYRTFAIVPGWL